MAEGKCATCARYLLIFFNLVFWIVGILFMGVGIWLVASPDSSTAIKNLVHIQVSITALNAVGYAVLGIGSFIFFIGFCGCCGAIRESAFMLGVYVIFMVVLLCGELAAIIYVALEKTQIETMVSNQLFADIRNYTGSRNDSAIDFIQLKFQCCGVNNFTDYRTSYFFQQEMNMSVPDSCCLHALDDDLFQPMEHAKCQTEAKNENVNGDQLFTNGCFVIMKELIDDNSEILIGILAGIIVLEILGLAFAVFLCRHRTEYDYYDD